MNENLLQQVLRFLGVGSIGFVVDGGLLWLLLLTGIDPYLARLVSFPIAVVTTWWLNRSWTFQNADKSRPRSQFGRYLGVQLIGAISNFVTYALVIETFGVSISNAMVGFTVGSAVGMVVNFLGAKYYAFSS